MVQHTALPAWKTDAGLVRERITGGPGKRTHAQTGLSGMSTVRSNKGLKLTRPSVSEPCSLTPVLVRRGGARGSPYIMTGQSPSSDDAFRAAFHSKERWLRWPAAAWTMILGALLVTSASRELVLSLLVGLGVLSIILLGLALWAWHCPRCSRELELFPRECKHCGLSLRRSGTPSSGS